MADGAQSRGATMRAAVVTGPGVVEIVEAPRPSPSAGEVRVRLEGCGVCASNLGPWSGPDWMQFPTQPGALGHEGWGLIDAVGEGVDPARVGQRVALLSGHAYAQWDVAAAEAAIALPAALEGRLFPGEAFGCAMNIFKRSAIAAGQSVAIVGAGFLGAVLTRLAASAGARVIAISRRDFALELARRMGAAETVVMDDHWRIIDTVKSLTAGQFCGVVIEATGKAWPLDLAAELTAERGRLVIAGYHQDGPRQINMQLWNWRGLDVVNAHERDPKVYAAGVEAAARAAAQGMLAPEELITHVYPLDQLAQALDATRDRPEGFLKAVVAP